MGGASGLWRQAEHCPMWARRLESVRVGAGLVSGNSPQLGKLLHAGAARIVGGGLPGSSAGTPPPLFSSMVGPQILAATPCAPALTARVPTTAAAGSRFLNYRHGFHAGNFADCFKHTMLLAVLK